MLNVTVLCVGKLKEAYWRDACTEYAKRLSAFCRFQVVELDETRLPEKPSAAQIEMALAAEGKQMLSRIQNGAAVIALCIEGKTCSSPELADLLGDIAVGGRSQVVFCIGSSFGLSPEIKARADRRLSMSPMTFPHQLARVMLCEQIYRAMQIQNGGKYHK